MRRSAQLLLLALLLQFALLARESQQALTTATVLALNKHERGRIAYWEKSVPIYDDYPFYDITLESGKKHYIVRYESMTGYYPAAWQAGKQIQVRIQKGRMYLLNGTEEVETDIVNSRAEDCVQPSARPTVITIGPQVPC